MLGSVFVLFPGKCVSAMEVPPPYGDERKCEGMKDKEKGKEAANGHNANNIYSK